LNIKTLSKNETDIVKIIFALIEGFDTVEKISHITQLQKSHITYLLKALKHAGFLFVKPETKQWRINVNTLYFWNTSQGYAYEEGIFNSLSKLKEVIDAQT